MASKLHPLKRFQLELTGDKILGGIYNTPSERSSTRKYLPLVVALHGGTYDAEYFDVDDEHTIGYISNALAVPVVAINRPGYGDSSSFYPIPEGSSYPQEYGAILHSQILPRLWTRFGQPNGCNSIVLLAHSLGATGAIIAGSENGGETADAKSYPLGGIIISGFGTQQVERPDIPSDSTTHIKLPARVKDFVMLPRGSADAAVYEHTDRLNRPMPMEEVTSMAVWAASWRVWAARITVPVMFAIAGADGMWKASVDHVQDFCSAFTGSNRVDGCIVVGAPHNMELSYWSDGWYARCFGFALECSASFDSAQ
ncbi:hypothetical protein ZTR_09126 [Talaromyces verruculosus]|nr:hypothetical protein ZTR_09126 [Talaromyces verruculosus]